MACGRVRPARSRRSDQGAGAGGSGTAPGERDFAQSVGVFCDGGARPPVEAMIAFIDAHRAVYGVEPICRMLLIAPSTYHAHMARRTDPDRLPLRVKRDARLATGDPPGVGGEFPGLWRAQTLAPVAPGGDRDRPLHYGAVYEADGVGGTIRGKPVKTTISNPAGRSLRRQGEPAVSRAQAECPVGV